MFIIKVYQTFVNVFLKELNAQNSENFNYRGYHTLSMELIPVMILEQLEMKMNLVFMYDIAQLLVDILKDLN